MYILMNDGTELVLDEDGEVTRRTKLSKAFNPNQPRVPAGDPRGGQWTDGNAPNSGTKDVTPQAEHMVEHPEGDASKLLGQTLKEMSEEEFMASLTQEQRDLLAWAEAEMAKGVPTTALVSEGGFKNPDGTWTEERQALHAKILENFFSDEAVANATPAEGESPQFIYTGGRPGAGKSSARALFDASKFLAISADDFQEHLPGYKGHLASGLFNPEGQYLAERAKEMARELRLNILYDVTMKSTAPAEQLIRELKAEGFKVKVYFTHTAPHVAALRTVTRFQQQGRYVPPMVAMKSLTNEQTFDKVRPLLDEWALFDSNGASPRLVASGVASPSGV